MARIAVERVKLGEALMVGVLVFVRTSSTTIKASTPWYVNGASAINIAKSLALRERLKIKRHLDGINVVVVGIIQDGKRNQISSEKLQILL